jgi:tetratricopeptide (TPR) repeat protein
MNVRLRESARVRATGRIARTSPAVLLTLLGLFAASGPVSATMTLLAPQDSVEQLASRAEELETAGKWEDAESIYHRILDIDPRSIAALNRLGAIEVGRGRFETGIRYYERALALNSAEFATNLNLGIAYIKKQDYQRAVTPLERAAQTAPENFQVRELLGGALVGRNDFSHAIPQLEKASQLNPNDLGTLYLLERSYLESKQFEKALATFERLQSLDPNSAWVRILRGQAEDGIGNYQNAIEEFETARQQLPGDAIVRFSLGFMYWKVHRFTEAEAELEQAVRLDPDFEEAKYYLADTYLMDGKPAAALPLLEDLTHAHTKDARSLADLGKAFEKLNRDTEATQAYEACLRIEPERADVHYQLARIYKKQKRSNESARELAIAKRLQQTKRMEQETLLQASGAHGDPIRQGEGLFRSPVSNDKSQ